MYRDNLYNFLLLLHILSVVVAFAPGVMEPLLGRAFANEDSAVRQRLNGYLAANGRRVHAPALILAGLFGILLIVRSDDVIKFDDAWVNMALLVWFAMNGILHAMIIPAQRKIAAGNDSALGLYNAGGGLINLLFLVMLYLMIFKP